MTIETSSAGKELVRADELRVGDRVRIEPSEQILASLDSGARIDGLPFMPEMLAFAGRMVTVEAVTHRTWDTVKTPEPAALPGGWRGPCTWRRWLGRLRATAAAGAMPALLEEGVAGGGVGRRKGGGGG